MKRSIILLFVVASMLLAFQPASAQTTNKFGHVNISKLLPQMPEYKSAEKMLQSYAKQLQDELASLDQQYNEKLAKYEELVKANTMPAILKVKQNELLELQNSFMTLQASSEEQLLEKQVELLKPIEEKVMGVIQSIAKEKGYTYIFDTSPGASLLYYPESDDLSEEVKTKLGLQP